MEPMAASKPDPFPLMVLRGGIEFTEWFADWCERMEAQILESAAREKEQLMFDSLARFADGNARRIGIFAILFFLLAGALGGSVASRLDPYGADDPATETVQGEGTAAGRRPAGAGGDRRGRRTRRSPRPRAAPGSRRSSASVRAPRRRRSR